MNLCRLVALIAAGLCCATAVGADQHITCPAHLSPEALQSPQVQAGWSLYVPRELPLSEGGMLHGPPDESGYLAPYDTKSVKNGKTTVQTQRWTFQPPHAFPTWLYCGYGGGGAPLQLFRRIPDGATECTAATRIVGSVIQGVEFVCRSH